MTTSHYRHNTARSAPVSTALGIEFLQRETSLLSGKQPFFLFVTTDDVSVRLTVD